MNSILSAGRGMLVSLVALPLLVAAAGGCQNNNKKKADGQIASNPGVTDIQPAQPAPAQPMAFQPAYPTSPAGPAAQGYGDPNAYPQGGFEPVPATPAVTQTPAAAPAAPAAAGNSHTVQKGDTLYGIARQRYGDGKQWQRIAAANPGVSPSSLKVGQTLVIP